MSKEIFHDDAGTPETWLFLNDDGELIYTHDDPIFEEGRLTMESSYKKITVEEAKARWPQYAATIGEKLSR